MVAGVGPLEYAMRQLREAVFRRIRGTQTVARNIYKGCREGTGFCGKG